MEKSGNAVKSELYIVGIGASAGGLEALQELFEFLPSDLGAAYVIVQHLSPDFKSMMDELLSKNTDMAVHQAQEGEVLKANTVYLIHFQQLTLCFACVAGLRFIKLTKFFALDIFVGKTIL